MPRFRYRALRHGGGEIEGELVAEDAHHAAVQLQATGNFPVVIAPAATGLRWHIAAPRLGGRDLVLFTRQLAALLSAGLALDRALGLVAGERSFTHRAAAARALLAAVNRGEKLSRAMAEENRLSRAHAMLIASGEARGDIAGGFERLANLLERNRAIRQSLVGALTYPASVVVVACLSLSFLLGFVVPRFAPLLNEFHRAPPVMMQALIVLSRLATMLALPLAFLVLALVLVLAVKRRDPVFRAAIDRRLLALPAIGPLLRKVEAERLSFLIGTMIKAGVTVPDAVAAARDATGHAAFAAALGDAGRAIQRGDGVAAAIARSALVPPLALELVRVGEETGDLASMLIKASDLLRQEIEATATEWIGLVAPLSMVVLGLVIGAIALALFGTVLEVYDLAT